MNDDRFDADMLTAQFDAIARQERKLRKQGLCTHGARQGLPNGLTECRYCHKVATAETLDDERRELLI